MMPLPDTSSAGPGQNARFTTTHWSVVLAAGGPDSGVAREALERLCQTYWYPLYAYARRRGNSPEDAEDLSQELFARLIERNDFANLSKERGRFRAFLLAALNHLLSDEYDRARAAKRGGGKVPLSLDAQTAEGRYRGEPADTLTPERLYDRRWAFTVLEKARVRLREEYEAVGKGELFKLLRFLEPGAEQVLPLVEIGRRVGKSEDAVKKEAYRLRQRYGQLVRAEIAQTVSSVAEIDEEVRCLLAAIAD
jgi:RNA polymerase sigma-70 factor (ECF subfamily)